MFKINTKIIISLVSLILVIFTFSGSASAIEYGGIGGRPAMPRPDNPRTESIFVHAAVPGQKINEAVKVINNSDTFKTLRIYGGDYIPSSGGGFACRQFAEEQREVGSWMEFDKTEVVLAPKTNETVPFTINVPENAGVGENNGCVLIEEKKDLGEEVNDSGANIQLRTGLRVAITVPGEIKKRLDIIDFAVTKKEDKNFLLKAKIHNTGNVSIDADVAVATKNMINVEIDRHGGEFSILRDQTSEYNFELKRPYWGGFFVSRLVAAYDPSTVVELGKRSEEKRIVLESRKVIFFSPPTLPAAIIEIIILLFVLFIVFTNIKKKVKLAIMRKGWSSHTILPGDTVQSLANKNNISWKVLADVNNLSAPYDITPGSRIMVPGRGSKFSFEEPIPVAKKEKVAAKRNIKKNSTKADKKPLKKSSKKVG